MTSANTARNNTVGGSSEQLVQNPAKTTKKVYSREFMLERSALPITSTEPEYMKDFEDLRIINPSVDVPFNARELTSQINVHRRPSHNDNARVHNSEPSRVDNRADDNRSNGIRFRANNNTQAELYRGNNRNSRYDGYTGERRQYNYHNANFNANQHSSENRSNFNRRPLNSERYNRNSRSYDSNNTGFRNDRRFSGNGDESRVNNTIPEHEMINSTPKKGIVIHYSLAKNSTVELSTSKNAWVPSCRDTQKSTKTDEEQTEEILKKVRSILNKITPETMVVLTKSIVEMQITTYDCLKKIIELLFQKAIDEPNFTPQYAYICSQMKNIEVMSDDEVTKTSFRQLIVLKCQETFEMVSAVEKNAVKSLSEINSCEDQGLKKELQSRYDENERIQRKRSVGNCRFMCEMFKVKLLNSNVLQMCVRHLLKFPKEEPLECLCNILKHIGKDLKPENTYEKLREFSSASYKTRISSRIRFMIQDIIDLKNNDWIPRNAVVKPKTLNEIEEEFSMAPVNNRMSSECTQPIEKPLNNYLNSNAQKVSIKSSNIQMKNESSSTTPQGNMNKQNTTHSNFEKKEVENRLLTNHSQVELNTCKDAWVPRFRIAQNSTATSEVKIESKINEKKTIKLNLETKKIESNSSTKNSENELQTCKNPWVPRFRNSLKLTETNEVEIKEIAKKVTEHKKSDKSIKIKTDYKQSEINKVKTIESIPKTLNIEPDLSMKHNDVELKACKNPWVPRFRNTPKLTTTNKMNNEQNKITEEKIVESNLKPKNIKPDLLSKNNGDDLKTCKNTWVPQFRNSQKLTGNNKLKIKDPCETFNSIIFSMTQENIVSLTNKLIPRISSIELIEETIDILFKRVTTEPSSISLLVEICSLLKGIVLSSNKGSMHVSFKKQLAVRCQKQLRMRIPTISKETYAMIGGLFNKKLLPLNIMKEFLKDIPNKLTDASIENLCYLLKIIGAEIERPYTLKPTIKHLEEYVNNVSKGFDTLKYKNEVKDLLELRNNKWIPVKLIDSPPPPVQKDQNVNRSHLEICSVPKERKRGKNRRTKNLCQ